MASRSRIFFTLGFAFATASAANAQMPIHFSFNGGVAVPVSNETNLYKNGIHAGIGVKVLLVPVQVDGTFDRMSAKSSTNKDLTILGAGATLPINITPGLLPVGLYLLAGGGVYRHKAETTATDFGINGGVGVRVGVPFIRLFVEGRGVAILSSVNRLTYATAALGVRF